MNTRLRNASDGHKHLRAVGYVGVVATVLDDSGGGTAAGIGQAVDRDHDVEPERRRNRDNLRPFGTLEQAARRLCPGGRAGSGGISFASPLWVAGRHGESAVKLKSRALTRGHGAPLFPASSNRALTAAAVTAVPPLRPRLVTKGTWFCAQSRRFASSTPTKPTGMPTTQAGRQPSSSIKRMASSNAVGALPIATTTPSPTQTDERRRPAAERVMPSDAARSADSGSSRLHTAVTPSGLARSRRMPARSISTSATTGAPFLKAETAAAIAPGEN